MKHAEVILLAPLKKKGDVGALVKVPAGYARNFLLPRGLAVLASKKTKEQLAHQMRIAEHHKAKAKKDAVAYAQKLSSMKFEFKRKVGDQGKLFGSVTSLDIHRALKEMGVDVEKHDVILADTIHQLGPASAEVRLGHDVKADLNLMVVLDN